ncbi:MAG TPA: hypothetical protein VMX18_03670 [Candidatus Bipolaricaulota bacterium]|nr:hypothetical protein [Candidatus Bipolaricaulota bacterium]
MNHFLYIITILSVAIIFFSSCVQPTLAIATGLEQTADQAGLQSESIAVIVGRIIRVILTLLGVILLLLLIYAGIMWMTAGGDANQVKKAKEMIINAMIGLAIVLSAYAISDYVVRSMIEATGGSLPPAA